MPHTISRREFLAGTATALTAGPTLFAAETQPDASPRYFDIHVHLTHRWFGAERGPVTADVLLRWMDANDVERAAVLPLVSPEAFWYPVTSEFVIAEAGRHPDRLIPFCAIDPRTLGTHLTETKQVVDMLNRYIDAGARGFGEHKALLDIDDPLNMKLYEACSKAKLPVLFHLDNRANMDKPGLPGLAKVLKAFPELVMIGHGKGWWASIAGGLAQPDLHVGYPAGPVAPGGAIDALMDRFPNLYGDLSSSGAHALLRDREFGGAFLRRRANRLLFGTDFYDLKQKSFPQFDLFRTFAVNAKEREKIAHTNAAQLLRVG